MFFVLLQLFPIDFDDLPSNICDRPNVNNDPSAYLSSNNCQPALNSALLENLQAMVMTSTKVWEEIKENPTTNLFSIFFNVQSCVEVKLDKFWLKFFLSG